mgnify:FL=1|tara:strand:- start:190 stop:402 length:213 start_codon:yes stop_codon:yes gene_type:complete
MMTRKHYIEFANMISDLINDNNNDINTICNTVEQMMRVFKIDNRNFNATKFKDYIEKDTGYNLDFVYPSK